MMKIQHKQTEEIRNISRNTWETTPEYQNLRNLWKVLDEGDAVTLIWIEETGEHKELGFFDRDHAVRMVKMDSTRCYIKESKSQRIMYDESETTNQVPKPVLIKVLCSNCKNITKHRVLFSIKRNDKGDMGDGDWIYWCDEEQIIECLGCENLSFRIEKSNSEDYDEEHNNIVTELVYPKRSVETWPEKVFSNVPYNLRRVYRETIDCFNNDLLTLCGAGLRDLVEGLCNENDIKFGEEEIIAKKTGLKNIKKQKDLRGKIIGLYQKGFLTKQSADVLHEHRFLGNESVHELYAPYKNDLIIAIKIIEHVLDNVYEIPVNGMQLEQRRLKRSKKTLLNIL
ncbi:DUF4145 domain-containing protein [Spirosoma sp. KNUC1025]|uniref:DUF4145 domain-containing protein n=1 Tax=Spirosoma sp. KNUC1025 TaxID=2894082 RepID=UPI0038690C27|nr:DUF4145 domain-containing protein [Spirosoma sp. KNUC1025]